MNKYSKLCSFSISDHADEQMRRRGFKMKAFDLLADFSDSESSVGGGAISLSLSRKGLDDLDPEDRKSKAAEKAVKAAMVVKGETIVTATNLDIERWEKHYRAGLRKDGHPHRPRSRHRFKKFDF